MRRSRRTFSGKLPFDCGFAKYAQPPLRTRNLLAERNRPRLDRPVKGFEDRPAVPFLRQGQAERPGSGGGGIGGLDGGGQWAGAHTGAGNYPGDGHIFGCVRAVRLFVPAVVGGDDDNSFLAQAMVIQVFEQRANRFIGMLDNADILRRHPAVDVSHRVRRGEVDEHHAEIGREFFRDFLGDDHITVVDVTEDVYAGGFGDLAQFFLADEHDRFQTGGVGDIEQVDALSVSFFREIIVPVDAVFGRAKTRQHGCVRWQGDAGEYRLRGEGVCADLHQCLQVGHRCGGDGIRAQSVDAEDEHAPGDG